MSFNGEQNSDMKFNNALEKCLSSTIDMSEIYFKLGMNRKLDSRKCPSLICGLNLPGDYDYITTVRDSIPIFVCTRKGLTNEDVIRIMSGENESYNGISQTLPAEFDHPSVNGFITERNSILFWLVGSLIAKSMCIRCPHIFILNASLERAKNCRGNTFNASGIRGKTTLIEIYDHPTYSTNEMLAALAHEMRHCWQAEKHSSSFFSQYKDISKFDDERVEEYYLQSAEIDARAYELRFIQACTGIEYTANTFSPIVNKAIESYAKNLEDSLFEPFADILKNSFQTLGTEEKKRVASLL